METCIRFVCQVQSAIWDTRLCEMGRKSIERNKQKMSNEKSVRERVALLYGDLFLLLAGYMADP